MAQKSKEPSQKRPQGEEIPIPKRRDFLKNLKKTDDSLVLATWHDARFHEGIRKRDDTDGCRMALFESVGYSLL